jgi:hypothetical protein
MLIRPSSTALVHHEVQPRAKTRQCVKILNFVLENGGFPRDFVQPIGCGSGAA